jgi:hypothetical protein
MCNKGNLMKSMNQETLGQGSAGNSEAMGRPLERTEERTARLYKSSGGPLLGWMFEEAHRRNDDKVEVAGVMGVTIGYLQQLINGQRLTADLSQKGFESCARYLGVPPIVVRLVGGNIPMSHFSVPGETEEARLDRAIGQIASDPKVQRSMPVDLMSLPLEARKAVVYLHQQYTSVDFFDTSRLPNVVHWLQRAAIGHDEAEYQAGTFHSDTASG